MAWMISEYLLHPVMNSKFPGESRDLFLHHINMMVGSTGDIVLRLFAHISVRKVVFINN